MNFDRFNTKAEILFLKAKRGIFMGSALHDKIRHIVGGLLFTIDLDALDRQRGKFREKMKTIDDDRHYNLSREVVELRRQNKMLSEQMCNMMKQMQKMQKSIEHIASPKEERNESTDEKAPEPPRTDARSSSDENHSSADVSPSANQRRFFSKK
jgi:C4-dicarboxylate-specific signal transduction histidine kinase